MRILIEDISFPKFGLPSINKTFGIRNAIYVFWYKVIWKEVIDEGQIRTMLIEQKLCFFVNNANVC